MISHIVSTFSGKPIFGLNGPRYLIDILKRAICGKVTEWYSCEQNTISLSHFFYTWIFYDKEKFFRKDQSADIYTKFVYYQIYVLIIHMLVLVKIFVYYYNPQITKARIFNIYKSNITLNSGLSMLVGISEAIRSLFLHWKSQKFHSSFSFIIRNHSSSSKKEDIIFNQWLAGLIDGDGCFQLSKKGYASLEIVMETRDKHCLYLIKQRFGGSVKLRSGVKWLRYRLHHKKGLLDLIQAIKGQIRNPIRFIQLAKICDLYNIELLPVQSLTYENGWFSGFFDSDGSVYLNLESSQMFITASQKNKYILEPLMTLYGGSIYLHKENFKWVVYKKSEVIKILDYFKLCPSRSAKHKRLKAIKRFYELREVKAHLSSTNSVLGKAWNKFILKWNKWESI